MHFHDPRIPRVVDGWRSPRLGMEMPIASYGHAGVPILLLPTAAADFLENERFFLVKAIESFLIDGRVRLFSIDSINAHAWMDRTLPVREKARRQSLYSAYIEEEVVPYIRTHMRNQNVRPFTTGASFGAFHAANAFFRRPDLFRGTIAMSGFYDLEHGYLEGYSDDNAYYNNPLWYLRGLEGRHLERLQRDSHIVIVTGQGAYEAPDASRRLAEVLGHKGIPHTLDLWGHDVRHDWPSWRQMLPYHLRRLGI